MDRFRMADAESSCGTANQTRTRWDPLGTLTLNVFVTWNVACRGASSAHTAAAKSDETKAAMVLRTVCLLACGTVGLPRGPADTLRNSAYQLDSRRGYLIRRGCNFSDQM